MLVKPGEHVHLARLFQFMDLGERLARDCAKAQSTLAPEPGMRTFLVGQARQEGRHAMVFQWTIRWLAPRFRGSDLVADHINRYRRLLMSAIEKKDFAESLMAEQILMEGLGEAILKRLERGLLKHRAPFRPLRRLLIQQEEAHRGFGLRTLNRMMAAGQVSVDQLRIQALSYMNLLEDMVFSVQDSFNAISEDPQCYWDDFQRGLPVWLQEQTRVCPKAPLISTEISQNFWPGRLE